MTSKSLIAGLATVAAMAAVLWSVPAAAGMAGAAHSRVYYAHDKWPAHRHATCTDKGHNDGDHDCDDADSVPEPGTLALLALGVGGIGLGRIRKRRR